MEKLKDIVKIKNEIKNILEEIDSKENILIQQFEENNYKLSLLKNYLEDVIEEYHIVCRNLYK